MHHISKKEKNQHNKSSKFVANKSSERLFLHIAHQAVHLIQSCTYKRSHMWIMFPFIELIVLVRVNLNGKGLTFAACVLMPWLYRFGKVIVQNSRWVHSSLSICPHILTHPSAEASDRPFYSRIYSGHHKATLIKFHSFQFVLSL